MPKHRTFLAAPPGFARAAFPARAVSELAPALLDASPALSAHSVCIADAAPDTPPWQRPGEPPQPADPPYDAVFDLHGDDKAIARALARLDTLTLTCTGTSVRVAETIERDDLPRPEGRAPGVKFLSLMTFHPDLPEAAARRLWSHHAPLALRVHTGAARYVRDWVTHSHPLPSREGAGGGASATSPDPHPPFHAIAELHFPTAEAMMTSWFADGAGRAAIIHDVGHFLHHAVRLYTTEHVIKPHP